MTFQFGGGSVPKNFIIIEPDPIVCMDVEGMLATAYPESRVIAGASLSDIGSAIYTCSPNTMLFVKGALVSDSDDLRRVLQTAAARGCRIVTIGEAEGLDVPVTHIELPFTTDMVIAAVTPGHVGSDPTATN